jgi:hypothetical protein
MNYEFCDAIARLEILGLSYDGYIRCVERPARLAPRGAARMPPHGYGRSNARHDVLRCWQVSGRSDANDSVGWKLLIIDKVRSLRDSRGASQDRAQALSAVIQILHRSTVRFELTAAARGPSSKPAET